MDIQALTEAIVAGNLVTLLVIGFIAFLIYGACYVAKLERENRQLRKIMKYKKSDEGENTK